MGTTDTTTVAAEPGFNAPRLAMTPAAFVTKLPWDELAASRVTLAGRILVKATAEAVFGPPFMTVKV